MAVHAWSESHPVASPPVTGAQVLFSIALGAIALFILFFGLYVVSSTMWGERWYRPGRKR